MRYKTRQYTYKTKTLKKLTLGLFSIVTLASATTFALTGFANASDYTVEYIAPTAIDNSTDTQPVPVFVDTKETGYLTETIQPKVKTYEEYKKALQDTNTSDNTTPQDPTSATAENTKQAQQETQESNLDSKELTEMQKANIKFALCLRNYGVSTPNELHSVSKYSELIEKYAMKHSSKYTIPSLMIECMSLQESNDNPLASNGHAGGLLQIEDTNLKDFKSYSISQYNEYWVSEDRYHVEKNIDYACHKVAILLDLYQGDYVKALQAYNYSQFSLNKLLNTYGDNWFNNRDQMARLNNKASYGDPKYVEHVASKLSI